MQNYTTILKALKMAEGGYSTREIRRLLHISSGALDTIKKRFKVLGIPLDDLEKMSPNDIENSFYKTTRIRDDTKVMPDYKYVYDRLNEDKSRANLYFLWIDYKKENPYGYQYTQYKYYFNKWLKEHGLDKNGKLTMVVERIPGEIIYIDWAGDTLACVNNEEGKLIKTHFFITTIGVSSLIFVKAYKDEKIDKFIDGVVSSLKAYEAVPKFLKPDNLKTGVTKHNKDELILTSAFRDLERHYDVIVTPPPSRKPRGKATVESGVNYIETHVIERLKGHIFNDFDELNKKITDIVYELNNRARGSSKTRQELFDTFDRPNMRPLPNSHFSVFDYKVQTVPNNYHLEYDNHYYSVPYELIRQELILKADLFDIYITDRFNKLVAHHQRAYSAFPKYITVDDHMPKDHQFYKIVNTKDGDYYRRWAKVFGDNMYTFIDRLLKSYDYEEQAYNSANGLLHLAKNYPVTLVEEAAKECLLANNVKYTYLKKALESKKTKGSNGSDNILPVHKNIRGKDEYK